MPRKFLRSLTALLCALFLPIGLLPAQAASTPTVLLQDTFTSDGQVDLVTTTARIDKTNGHVELAQAPLGNVISAKSGDGGMPTEVLVADKTGVHWYTYDQASGQMVKNTPLSTAAYTNPLGVSLLPGMTGYYVMQEDGVHQVLFDGTSSVDNPMMAVTGLVNPVSVSAVSATEYAVADDQGNVSVYTYDPSSNTALKSMQHSFSTGLTGIKNVQAIPGTWDFIVTTEDGAYRYMYDQFSDTYRPNPAYTTAAGTPVVVAGAANGTGDLITLLTDTTATAYAYDQATGSMTAANLYTIGGLTDPVAVALPSNSSTVIASRDGTVRTYVYDAATNSMMENTSLRISGLQFAAPYIGPSGRYRSRVLGAASYNMFRLTATESNDAYTAISYEISLDGGTTFVNLPKDSWHHLPAGSTNPPSGGNVANGPYILQATLYGGEAGTPRLLDVRLEAYLDTTAPTAPGVPTAVNDPSYAAITPVTWTAATDDNGIGTYLIRTSTDGGVTWGPWIDTLSATPGYDLVVPADTEATYQMEVKARDTAGNEGPVSPVGSVYINTKPIGIITDPATGLSIKVTKIYFKSDNQAPPPYTALPVLVKAGGQVVYEITTTGHAQNVEVTYSDGLTQALVPKNPIRLPDDQNVWVGYYYPSSTRTIALDTPQGTIINLSNIKVTRPGSEYNTASELLQVDGSLANNKFLLPILTE